MTNHKTSAENGTGGQHAATAPDGTSATGRSEALPAGASVSIAGLRVLVAEDEPLIAMVLEDILDDLQCAVVGPHANLAEALAAADGAAIDLALLDVNIRGGASYPVAEALDRRGIPFAFMTGQDTLSLPESFRARTNLSKPYTAEDVERVLRGLAGGS